VLALGADPMGLAAGVGLRVITFQVINLQQLVNRWLEERFGADRIQHRNGQVDL
jgi:hypothetical protein